MQEIQSDYEHASGRLEASWSSAETGRLQYSNSSIQIQDRAFVLPGHLILHPAQFLALFREEMKRAIFHSTVATIRCSLKRQLQIMLLSLLLKMPPSQESFL